MWRRTRLGGRDAAAWSIWGARHFAGNPRKLPKDELKLKDFFAPPTRKASPPALLVQRKAQRGGQHQAFYIETFGCQMNVSDSEVVDGILQEAGYSSASSIDDADVAMLNTCAIRENAENKVWNRLEKLHKLGLARQEAGGSPMKIGVLGCMAERLKEKFLEGRGHKVDFVVGPDSYRDLPGIFTTVLGSEESSGSTPPVSVQLSADETYADIAPVRNGNSKVSSFVSIMRGCNNMCSFCIVPFVRGRERSRDPGTIVDEVASLSEKGFKEVMLLGQNVNSYFHGKALGYRAARTNRRESRDGGAGVDAVGASYATADGFTNMFKLREGDGVRFAELLARVAEVDPEMRIRFMSPHPKDFPDAVLSAIASYPNICKGIHMPLQSGSTEVLSRMRRGHSMEAYLNLIRRARALVPGIEFSTDIIAGFCGETEEDHRDTLSVIREAEFEQAYTFAYSMRERTHAWHRLNDDVPQKEKKRRLNEVIACFRDTAFARSWRAINEEGGASNRLKLVLVEGTSRKSRPEKPTMTGRGDTHVRYIFSDEPAAASYHAYLEGTGDGGTEAPPRLEAGNYVCVRVDSPNVTTLEASPLFRTTLTEFANLSSPDLDRILATGTAQ